MVQTGQTDLFHIGDLHSQRFPVLDENGDPFPTTGRVIRYAMALIDPATGLPSATNALEFDSGDDPGNFTRDDANGVVDVVFNPSDTTSLAPGEYYFQFGVFDSLGANQVVSASGVNCLVGTLLGFT